MRIGVWICWMNMAGDQRKTMRYISGLCHSEKLTKTIKEITQGIYHSSARRFSESTEYCRCSKTTCNVRSFRSERYLVTTREMTKICLSCIDDKRYLLSDSVHSLAYGHKDIVGWGRYILASCTHTSCSLALYFCAWNKTAFRNYMSLSLPHAHTQIAYWDKNRNCRPLIT